MQLRTLVLSSVVCTACSTRNPPNPPPVAPTIAGLKSIAVEPATRTLVIAGATAAQGTYQATGTFTDGHVEDITAKVTFGVSDGSLGAFQGPTFTSFTARGGSTAVLATSGGVVGLGSLTIQLEEQANDPSSSLPTDPSARFAGPPSSDPARAPRLVYPNDGVVVPPNLGQLEIHFLPGAGNTLFELAFETPFTDVKIYARCTQPTGGGCIYTPTAQVWSWIAESNRGGAPVAVSLRATDDAGSAVAASNALKVAIAEDDIQGGLYYWTTSGATAIMRFDFAGTKTQAEKFVGPEAADGKCIGCHALSPDGHKLVAEADGQNSGALLLLDVATAKPLVPFDSTPHSTFESWDPSGARFVGVYGDAGATDYDLRLFDGATGVVLGSIPGTGTADHPADHPDWSSDGKSIAYVKVGFPNTLQRMSMGAIELVSANGPVWSAPTEIVPPQSGKNRYYPAFSPDGSFLVFNESTCPSGDRGNDCDADTDPTATLFAVAAQAGAQPIELMRANAPGATDGGATALTNSFPKWSPFVFTRSHGEAGTTRVEWLTFSSSRRYGLRGAPPGMWLWMVAVDPDRVQQGADPSFPAFALPFQDLSTSNHIAQWTQAVVPVIQ